MIIMIILQNTKDIVFGYSSDLPSIKGQDSWYIIHGIPDAYPLNLYLINNVKDTFVFWLKHWTVFNSNHVLHCYCSRISHVACADCRGIKI